jgi:hypothetical protein
LSKKSKVEVTSKTNISSRETGINTVKAIADLFKNQGIGKGRNHFEQAIKCYNQLRMFKWPGKPKEENGNENIDC